jgi:hypothetical protein
MIELDDVAVQLAGTLKTMVIERTALVTAEASAEQIAHKDRAIGAVREAQALILLKAEQDREEKHRAQVYEKWYPRAVDLKEKVETARQRHERAVMLYPPAEKNVDLIDSAICEHRTNEPRRQDFPSAKKIHQWNLRLRHLQEERQRREQSRIAAKTEMENAGTDLRKLTEEFQHAANTARLYAPRTPSAKPVPTAWTLPSTPPSRVTNSPV